MFNVITGLYPPDEGDVRLRGISVVGLAPNQLTRAGIARTFQNVHLFPNMTVLENAMVGQHCRSKAGVFGSILRPPSVRARGGPRSASARRRASSSSGRGWPGTDRSSPRSCSRTRTGAGSRWRGRWRPTPRILLLDEPTAGMNPRETLELRDHIVRMRDELGLTVLVIEHDMRVVKGVSDRVIACDYGRKIAEGTYEEVANDEQVIEAYLGVRHEELGMSDAAERTPVLELRERLHPLRPRRGAAGRRHADLPG